jgi:hypothetical protein
MACASFRYDVFNTSRKSDMKKERNRVRALRRGTIAGLALMLPLSALTLPVSAADIGTSPPANFKKVSSLVKLPDFVPGLGVLYVDPATLPVGPFLGYSRNGKLVNITYMVPLKDIEAHKNFPTLGSVAAGITLDHTDIQYNPGHPGVEEPHYHVVQWLINPAEVKAQIK